MKVWPESFTSKQGVWVDNMASSNKHQNRVLGSNLNPKQYRSSSCEIPRSNTMESTSSARQHRGSSPSFTHTSTIAATELQRPLGRYYYLHQQQQQQQQQAQNHHQGGGPGSKSPARSPSKSPSGSIDTSALASAVRVAATIGLSVSRTSPGEHPPGSDNVSPTLNSVNSSDLPYILRSVSGERGDVRPGAPSEPNEYNFNFKKRGLFIIINNKQFDENSKLYYREGSDLDAERLEERFQDLGFVVRRYDDVSCAKMTTLMYDAASHDHTDHDCFGCAILSHGREGVVYARDGHIALELLLLPFKGDRCPSLVGKPKLFFIQACQSSKPRSHLEPLAIRRSPVAHNAAGDEEVVKDSGGFVHTRRVPVEADCLICYSTVPGIYSWRNNQDGSWFIQALCIVLENYGAKMELLHMLTHVNRIVAYEFASCSDKEFSDSMKLMPSIVSMLTRYVYFRPKKQDIR